MFRVTGGIGIIWNPEQNCRLAKFVDGVFETEDQATAERLRAMGFAVEGEFSEKPIEKMTVKELKAYAAERGIELPEGDKAALLAAILAAGEP